MTRKLTDGERFIQRWRADLVVEDSRMSREIDRLIRRRQAEAWDAGYESHRDGDPRGYDGNPYRAKR